MSFSPARRLTPSKERPASLRNGAWPGDAPPLRPLLDARLTSMATLGFTLSGLEEDDGVLYAQSWYCREV